jgi:hypothetical protein
VQPEILVRFTAPTRSESGDLYWSRAVGRKAEDGLWDGWLEFGREGDEEIVRTERETTQPNRFDLMYWAEGLSDVYLEGALSRALAPTSKRTGQSPLELQAPPAPPNDPRAQRNGHAEHAARPGNVAVNPRVVLDPYATFAEGEELLRRQLHALSHDHLQNIVEAYHMTDDPGEEWPRRASEDELVERIVETVRASAR